MKIFMLTFFFCVFIWGQEGKQIQLLQIEIEELKRERQSVYEIMEQHKISQQMIASQMEELPLRHEDKLWLRLRRQELKSEIRWLLDQITLFSNKRNMLEKMLYERQKTLEGALWMLAEQNLPSEGSIPSPLLQNTLRSIDRMELISDTIVFFTLDPRWEIDGKEDFEKCFEKKMIWGHIIQAYEKYSHTLQEDNRMLSRYLAIAHKIIKINELQNIVERRRETLLSEIEKKTQQLHKITQDLQKARQNLDKAEKIWASQIKKNK